MSERIPSWLRKPTHKKEVVATEKGWVVKETGELLVSVRNLSTKLAEYFGVKNVEITGITETKEEVTVDSVVVQGVIDPVPVDLEPSVIDPVKADDEVDTTANDVPANMVDSILEEVDPNKKTWINKGDQKKLVKMSELQSFLDDGWTRGKN
jgi:hypothetical protein